MNVALAEDNNLLAASIQEKLEFFKDINFRFRAINGSDMLKRLSIPEENPIDVILMDIEMPEMNGIQAASIISEKFPDIKIIMLTVFDDEEKIFAAIKAGAIGYLLKDETPDKIYEGIKLALEGGAPMSPVIAAKTLQMLRSQTVITPKEEHSFSLSPREIDVLEQLKNGFNYNEISDNLFISPFTVRKHIENIYRKLQVNNKMQAVQKAVDHKII